MDLVLRLFGYRRMWVCEWGMYRSRYDGIDRQMGRPIHKDLGCAPPWAVSKIIPLSSLVKDYPDYADTFNEEYQQFENRKMIFKVLNAALTIASLLVAVAVTGALAFLKQEVINILLFMAGLLVAAIVIPIRVSEINELLKRLKGS